MLDASSVADLTLWIDGQTYACSDAHPYDTAWACDAPVNGLSAGDVVEVKIRPQDEHGHYADWSQPLAFIADTEAPTITLSTATDNAASDGLIANAELNFTGVISDNYLIDAVEICSKTDGEAAVCTLATLDTQSVINASTVLPNIPTATSPIGQCGGGEMTHAFDVSTTANVIDVDFGLTVRIADRSGLRAWLESPAGTRVQLLGAGNSAENLDILFNDATATLYDRNMGGDRFDHTVTQPYFENVRRPIEQLAKFNDEAANGIWLVHPLS